MIATLQSTRKLKRTLLDCSGENRYALPGILKSVSLGTHRWACACSGSRRHVREMPEGGKAPGLWIEIIGCRHRSDGRATILAAAGVYALMSFTVSPYGRDREPRRARREPAPHRHLDVLARDDASDDRAHAGQRPARKALTIQPTDALKSI
jgi:hypothetical protein